MLKNKIMPQSKIKVNPSKITIIGLSGSGKTTFLNQLVESSEKFSTIAPTSGVNIKTITDSTHSITFYDVGGQKSMIQANWKKHSKEANGIVT